LDRRRVILALTVRGAAVWCVVRLRGHAVGRAHFQPFAPLPETTQSVIDLDPRTVTEPRPGAAFNR
jgi:hypothetical protein